MKRKIIISTLIILFIYSLGGIFNTFYLKKTSSKKNGNVTINGYPYVMPKNYNSKQTKEFNKLKKTLENDHTEEEYINQLVKIFLMDLYTINNKKDSFDVSSDTYISKEFKKNYKLNVSDTLYKNINHTSVNKEDLPEVEDVNIIETNINEESIIVSTEIIYTKDLGYPKEEILQLEKINGIYFIMSNTET